MDKLCKLSLYTFLNLYKRKHICNSGLIYSTGLGNLNITVKEMINAQVEKDVEITTLTNCKIDAMKTTLVVADMLELGAEGAAFSAVKFETLYAYLNTAMGLIKFHLHFIQ